MAKITLEDIKTALSKTGWSCLDKTYVNLNTPMKFRCPEGHLVESTWGKFRNKQVCPVCTSNVKKHIANIAALPKTKEYRILALDQSSHKTGYSLYDGTELISYGVFEAKGHYPQDRFIEISDWLESMIANWQPDEIGLEETQYNEKRGANQLDCINSHDVFKLLSQIMGIVMIIGLRNNLKVSPVLISTWRSHCGVKGANRSERKRSCQMLVKEWHDILVSDDESDAICIGKYLADLHNLQKPTIGDDSWL